MSNTDESSEKKSKAYNPADTETALYESWVKAGYFHGNPGADKPSYSIVIPPPNVTDVLHLGHALNNTIQDILMRRHRMNGFEAEWLPGADHAGIATQVIVEKQLVKEGTTRREIGRDKFIERTRTWAYRNKELILGQLRRMGCSCDWDRTRFTLDEGLSRAVAEVFKHLYEKGWIYRGYRIVNWCPSCKTSLSDDEVEHEDFDSNLWYIRYKIKGADEYLTVATTRPETMLGDTALAVSPKDPRYKKYVGKTAILPILERELRIVADNYVDPMFGTGVVKVTPAHDPNDFEIGKRHDLEQINILNEDGTLNENADRYKGLDRFEARKKLLEDLTRKSHIEKTEKYSHAVGTCYRCHSMIEPYLSHQWFVKMDELAKPAIEAVKSGKLRFHPEYWTKTYLHWMENIRDWCISRQLWWGHRIPIWYAEDGTMFVSYYRPTADQCKGYDPATLVQDDDVLDTWFSSWLWPFSTFGWPEKTPELQKFYPTKVLVTASEIIFLWVARMAMAGYEFMGECPFSDVYIHGTVRDANGIKMSKSLGNGIDPLEVIEKHGADALRMSLVLATPDGQDPWLARNAFEGGRNFVNKLYQVSRFVMMRLDGRPPVLDTIDRNDLVIFDRWILSRLENTIDTVDKAFADYRLSAAAKTVYNFVWDDYCSWYIELIKPDQPGQAIRANSLNVATYVLHQTLRLLHPFVPFVTEEILHQLTGDRNRTLTFGPWPQFDVSFRDDQLENSLKHIQDVVTAVRSIRSELNVPPGKKSDLHIKTDDAALATLLKDHIEYFRSLARVENLICGTDVKKPPLSASAVISGAELYIPLAGLIDLEAEKARLQKNLDELRGLLEKVSRKLANADFRSNAPKDVVEKEQAKKEDYQQRIEKLNRNLEQILGW
ncbi:valine--tRNA ligase [candidate division GN15 bacterium]|uniref:Valine--tRNA ligase n=1 Tax=candidate division GN15 bacterium TaxID=2072418 RepID=A0A855X3Q8_9BACT|nr:MAG: valine--tRNA ligase [candidate division GN15 bacterium]